MKGVQRGDIWGVGFLRISSQKRKQFRMKSYKDQTLGSPGHGLKGEKSPNTPNTEANEGTQKLFRDQQERDLGVFGRQFGFDQLYIYGLCWPPFS